MRNWVIVAVFASLVTVIGALPALADAPEEFVITRVMEGEIDPCTGESMDVFFTWQVRAHVHSNNEVTRFDGYAETSTGYVANGTETQVVNGKWLTTTFNWMNDRNEDGKKFSVKGRVKIDLETGDFVKLDVVFRCLGRP